jgi:hypothetical protein
MQAIELLISAVDFLKKKETDECSTLHQNLKGLLV